MVAKNRYFAIVAITIFQKHITTLKGGFTMDPHFSDGRSLDSVVVQIVGRGGRHYTKPRTIVQLFCVILK